MKRYITFSRKNLHTAFQLTALSMVFLLIGLFASSFTAKEPLP
jgi:hypothetical protein